MQETHAEHLSRRLLAYGDELVDAGMAPDQVATGFLHAASSLITGFYGMPLGSWLITEAGKRLAAAGGLQEVPPHGH